MTSLYRSPLRVYLALAILSLIGIVSAVQLPISLFPNSSKPEITMCVGIDLAPDAFLRTYGEWIEEQLRAIRRGPIEVEKVVSTYSAKDACYDVDFKWGGDPDEAMREIQTVAAAVQGRLPQESRDRVNYWSSRENGGFLGLSFFSNQRSLTELYNILEPVLTPKLARVQGAQEAILFNPQKRQLLIELKPEAMATAQLFPSDVASAVYRVLESYSGGSITMDSSNLRIEFPRVVQNLEDFKRIQIPTRTGHAVSLGQVANLDLTVPSDSARIFKTSGASSIILWASPKPGGNIKAMAEEIRAIVDETMPSLPKDVQYKVLVDPSEFIRSSVDNVAHEVALAAGLAVIVLFLFVGNLKNVATAAIEIPISLVLAFILMRLSGMNLNLISLGGLALSAGMNVDASVVVMENIFRHFEEVKGKKLSFEERLSTIATAVKEVQFSVIASTVASLVVFIPLAFTSELSYAILGDLAKAVVFSHGFSAVVALVLVPTIRLQLMKGGMTHDKPSPLEGVLQRLENAYGKALGLFLRQSKIRWASYAGLVTLFLFLVFVVVPRLPREIIGKPDTDWLILGISTQGNTLSRQMESQTEQVENELLAKFGDHIQYTFTQINRVNNSFIMFRLKDKSEMTSLWKKVEEHFTNTPVLSYWMDAWNPAEMPLPDPPDFEVTVRGNENEEMAMTARDLYYEMQERQLFQRINVNPNVFNDTSLVVRPRAEQWPLLASQGLQISLGELADLTRTATTGRTITRFDLKGESMDIFMRFSQNYVLSPEELEALPIGVASKIIPLKAVAEISREEGALSIRRENGRQYYSLTARGKKDDDEKTKESVKAATELVEKWPEIVAERKAKKLAAAGENDTVAKTAAKEAVEEAEKKPAPTLQIEDSRAELNSALRQLVTAVSLSIALIFLTMVFQFGSVMNSLLVLVSVPLGFIGVVISLWVFKSTLSLNSMLGVILLNGLAVANSIILVDFLQRKVKEGLAPSEAAVEVARVRLRPILMTSMTTGLGMLPIALGFGEGGKILQPLGIAVAGGLGFSMITTLFIVPSLQVSWMEWRQKRMAQAKGGRHA